MNPSFLGLAFVAALSLSACGAHRPRVEATKPWKVGADALAVPGAAIPVKPLAVEPTALAAPVDPRLREKVSLKSEGTDIRSLLLGLSKQTGINIVVDEDVRGTVTAYFNDVELRDALRQILEPSGFDIRIDRDFLRVYRVGLETQFFRLQYLRGERSGESTVDMLDRSSGSGSSNTQQNGSGQQGSQGVSQGSGGQGGTSGQGGQGGGQQGASGGPGGSSRTKMTTKFSVNFWHDLSDELEAILFEGAKPEDVNRMDRESAGRSVSDRTGRSLTVNSMSGTIVVRASRRALDLVGRYLSLVESTIQRQVVIDMRILEVSIADDTAFGIETKNMPMLPSDIVLRSNLLVAGEEPRISTSTGVTAPAFTLGIGSENGWQATVTALGRVGDVHVVSAPRISALHNQKAFVKVVRDRIYYMAQVSPTVVTQTAAVSQPVQFVPVVVPEGIVVDVTPLIGDDGSVTLEIHPSFSVIFNEKQAPNNQGSQPEVERREFQTTVRVAGSETIVLGGLVSERTVLREYGIPYLKDIPFLGALFRKTENVVEKSELIVLLTPRVQGPALARNYLESLRRMSDSDSEPLPPVADPPLPTAPVLEPNTSLAAPPAPAIIAPNALSAPPTGVGK